MEPSEEIRSVVQRFFEALRDGDDQAVNSRISRQAGFERFGSDPAEWWRDGEEAVLIFRQQMRELGGRYPFGVSFLGRMWADDKVLGLAHAYEQATHHRRPPPWVR